MRERKTCLIEEDDGRLEPLGLLEESPQLPLALADPLGEDVGALQKREKAWGGKRNQRWDET